MIEVEYILNAIALSVLVLSSIYVFLRAVEESVFLQVVLLLVLVMGSGWYAWDAYYEEQMLKSAEIVPATVTDMRIGRGRRGGHSYGIYLAYTSPFDGTQQTDYAKLPSVKAYEETAIGDIVSLRVSIEDPSVTLLERDYPPSRIPFYFYAFASVFFISVGVVVIFIGLGD